MPVRLYLASSPGEVFMASFSWRASKKSFSCCSPSYLTVMVITLLQVLIFPCWLQEGLHDLLSDLGTMSVKWSWQNCPVFLSQINFFDLLWVFLCAVVNASCFPLCHIVWLSSHIERWFWSIFLSIPRDYKYFLKQKKKTKPKTAVLLLYRR